MSQKIKPYLKKTSSPTKDVFHLIDEEEGIKIKAKEIFKNTDKEIHYPWNTKYQPKYNNIEQIEYIGFKGKLPRGVYKNEAYGYGFTKILSPLIYYLDEEFKIQKVIIKINGHSSLNKSKKVLTLPQNSLDKIYPIFKNFFDQKKNESKSLVETTLFNLFPKEFTEKKTIYTKDSIYSILEQYKDHTNEFSERDISSILETLEKISQSHSILETKTLIKTKEVIESYYIEDVINQYQTLLKQKSETKLLESKWQEFFRKHTWIFSYILSLPVILHEDSAYVGGKRVSNLNGKITDFLIKNNLTKNVSFIEIKTHKTELIKKGTPYRGQDVYPLSSELTGAINQVLNQRDNFQKEFWALKGKGCEDFQTFNSNCVVLGSTPNKGAF